ncbi:MAG: DUF1015 domain-containing protein [Clostridia bacterium]|nr:DUF1015 domain-containing protein [Clostridia bacterium]
MNAVSFGEILLPKKGIDLTKWAVVACDQYTSEPEYWMQLKEWVGESPSTLCLICPECWLDQIDEKKAEIRKNSESYVKDILVESADAVLVKRQVGKKVRTGLVAKIDLECYSYEAKDKALIRATERTVPERIPPRMKVKSASRLDLPHVLCLIDDKDHPLSRAIGETETLYSFDLNCGGGHIEGKKIINTTALFKCLSDIQSDAVKLGKPFILVGDGNHSLASAKAYYQELKRSNDYRALRARYALVEIISIYDEGLTFEPIHRVIFSDRLEDVLKKELSEGIPAKAFSGEKEIEIKLPKDPVEAFRKVTALLDSLSEKYGYKVDYIHGEESLKAICKNGASGIVMPALEKSEFFGLVDREGVLPKKTFSLGEANEKRYYLESRDLEKRQ